MPRRRGGRRGTRGLSGFALNDALDSQSAGLDYEQQERLRRTQQSSGHGAGQEEEGPKRVKYIHDMWYVEDEPCSACGGSGNCPECAEHPGWVSDVSTCDVCYDEPGVGRKNHKCNTCKGVGLEVANII